MFRWQVNIQRAFPKKHPRAGEMELSKVFVMADDEEAAIERATALLENTPNNEWELIDVEMLG